MTVEELKYLLRRLCIKEINYDLENIFRKKIHLYKRVIWSKIWTLALAFSYFWKTSCYESSPHFYLHQALTLREAEKGSWSPPPFCCCTTALWGTLSESASWLYPPWMSLCHADQQSTWILAYSSMCLLWSLCLSLRDLLYTTYKSGHKETVVLP